MNNNRFAFFAACALALVLSGCGGGLNQGFTPTPMPTPTPAPVPTTRLDEGIYTRAEVVTQVTVEMPPAYYVQTNNILMYPSETSESMWFGRKPTGWGPAVTRGGTPPRQPGLQDKLIDGISYHLGSADGSVSSDSVATINSKPISTLVSADVNRTYRLVWTNDLLQEANDQQRVLVWGIKVDTTRGGFTADLLELSRY